MGKKLIVCSESLYTTVISHVDHENPIEVMAYDQFFLTQIQKENSRIVNFTDLIDHFIKYDDVYIISDSLSEGMELTLFFSEIGTKMIIVFTHNSRYISIYKMAGAKIVIITGRGNNSNNWLNHMFNI